MQELCTRHLGIKQSVMLRYLWCFYFWNKMPVFECALCQSSYTSDTENLTLCLEMLKDDLPSPIKFLYVPLRQP